ncbi:SpoIIE family protein phosphatase, partial [bacterium AH-315-M05]|nr:SpoIIE family protein phosphatase [bacterium AH-315-M05]
DHKNNLIRFAGAKNPLYIIHNGTLEMIKADIYSIGGKSYRAGKEVEPKFTGHEIAIEKNMVFYMFSDGYMDQFGGEPRKTFSSQSFKQLLLDNSKLEMHQQKAALSKAMEDWKGSYEQIDDMLVMGVRF